MCVSSNLFGWSRCTGYGYAGYTGYYDPSATAAYDASVIPVPAVSVETAHAVQYPPPAPPATPASAGSSKAVAVSAAPAPPPVAEVPPGAPPTPPGAPSSSLDAPVVSKPLPVEVVKKEPHVQVWPGLGVRSELMRLHLSAIRFGVAAVLMLRSEGCNILRVFFWIHASAVSVFGLRMLKQEMNLCLECREEEASSLLCESADR